MEQDMPRSDVLIIGAGPTGLVLALWLTKLGVKLRIIDKTAEPGTTSRALAAHARTLPPGRPRRCRCRARSQGPGRSALGQGRTPGARFFRGDRLGFDALC